MPPRPRWYTECAIVLFYLAVASIFFDSVTLTRSHTFITWFDNVVQYYAWMTKLVAGWHNLAPPLWDFGTDSGISFPGELQTGVFYPVNILFSWLCVKPDVHALDLLIVAHFAFGAWGMSLFLRGQGVGLPGSLLGGLVFSLLGPVANRANNQANIFVGLVYLPWVLYWYARGAGLLCSAWRNHYYHLAGISLGFSLLAGHPQPFIHATIVLVCFGIFLTARGNAAGLPARAAGTCYALASVGIIAAAVSFIQLAASFEYFARAYRWVGLPEPITALQVVPYDAYNLYTLKWHDLLSIFKTTNDIHDGGTLFLTVTVVVLSAIGLFSKSTLRWLALPVAVVSVLIALGDNTWAGPLSYQVPLLNKVREPVRILFLYQFAMATLAAVGLDLILGKAPRNRAVRGTIFVLILGCFLLEAHADRGKSLAALSKENKSGDSSYQRSPALAFLEHRSSEEMGLYRVLVSPKDLLPPNSGDVFAIKSITGHRSSMMKEYFDYLARDSSYGSRNLDALGARYLVTDQKIAGLPLLLNDGPLSIYQRPGALPIFQFMTAAGKPAEYLIKNVAWRQNAVSFSLQTYEAGFLTFAQPSYPGWEAKVNEAGAAIGPSDIFMRISVPSGESRVEWRYSPWWFPAGMAAWALVALVTLGSFLGNLRGDGRAGSGLA
jgi:hypothetical protein